MNAKVDSIGVRSTQHHKESPYVAKLSCNFARLSAVARGRRVGLLLRMNGFLDDCKLSATRRPAMTPGAPDVESPHDVPASTPAIYRERVVVRRRRGRSRRRPQHRSWRARASRRRIIRAFVV